jgi:hypothetical protein
LSPTIHEREKSYKNHKKKKLTRFSQKPFMDPLSLFSGTLSPKATGGCPPFP